MPLESAKSVWTLQLALACCSEALPSLYIESNLPTYAAWCSCVGKEFILGNYHFYFVLAPKVKVLAVSETGQVCEIEEKATSSDYCCCACKVRLWQLAGAA